MSPSQKSIARSSAGTKTANEHELRFTFTAEPSQNRPAAAGASGDDPYRSTAAPQGRETIGKQWKPGTINSHREEAFVISDPQTTGPSENTASNACEATRNPPDSGATPTPSPHADTNILSLDPYRDQHASTAPFLSLMALLLLLFAVVTAMNHVHPKAAEGLVKQIPLVGASVFNNSRLKVNVVLSELHADFQTIQGNRKVFVVSGTVANQNPVGVRSVQVTGQIFDHTGKQVEKHTIWVGNAISQKIVRGLTAQDVANLQTLHPLKSFAIPPGESIPFTIVFLKPSDKVKDFTCEIVSAEGVA